MWPSKRNLQVERMTNSHTNISCKNEEYSKAIISNESSIM